MKDHLKRSKVMYVVQTSAQFALAQLVMGAFLARLGTYLGMPDSLVGILSSIMSLGCMFQLLATVIRTPKVKKFILITSIISQVLYMVLYLIPVSPMGKTARIAAFSAVLLLAFVSINIAEPSKTAWLLGLVEDEKRGRFSAYREMCSLFTGMTFSYLMGALLDRFEEQGNIQRAFVITAGVIAVMMLVHTLALVMIEERPVQQKRDQRMRDVLREIVSDRALRRVLGVSIISSVFANIAAPFYGTYQLGELGMSLRLVTLLGVAGSVARILTASLWGRYADKASFAAMLQKCYLVMAAAYLCAALASPANGVVMFACYYILSGIAQGGMNNGQINLVFDYVAQDRRKDALGVSAAISGVAGFSTTLVFSAVLAQLQQRQALPAGTYAQQYMSAISVVMTLAAIVYMRTQVGTLGRKK